MPRRVPATRQAAIIADAADLQCQRGELWPILQPINGSAEMKKTGRYAFTIDISKISATFFLHRAMSYEPKSEPNAEHLRQTRRRRFEAKSAITILLPLLTRRCYPKRDEAALAWSAATATAIGWLR